MRLIRIGLGNADPTVGAFRTNTDQAVRLALHMGAEKCAVGVLPEQVISGYPAEDLIQWKEFVSRQWTELLRFAQETAHLVTAFVLGVAVEEGGSVYNCAAVVSRGKILGLVPKEKLPTYGVFFDGRTFARGIPYRRVAVNGVPCGDLIFKFPFGVLAVEVCEDIWSPDGPMRRRAYEGAEVIVNISASPHRAGVLDTRREMISTRAADNCVTVAYANMLGGNDALVMDGGGFVNQGGKMLLEARRWQWGVSTVVADLDRTARQRRENTTWRWDREQYLRDLPLGRSVMTIEYPDGPAADNTLLYPIESQSLFLPSFEERQDPGTAFFVDLIENMAWGLKGYFEKTKAFECLGISLSGGKDSALVLLAAYIYAVRKFSNLAPGRREYAIRSFIRCFSFPTRFNSETTKSIARKLCDALDVKFAEIPIEKAVAANEALALHMNEGVPPDRIAKQNPQPRTRGEAMWNWSNMQKAMWLQTGNMSEKAVGYTTIGGDLMGAYSLAGNMPKTVLIALLEELASGDLRDLFPEIPQDAILVIRELMQTTASAELEEDQSDERDLMPFPVLDACFGLFAGEKYSPTEVRKIIRDTWSDEEFRAMDQTFDPATTIDKWVERFVFLFRTSIFKWVQSPEAVHMGSLDLDRERALQLPSVQSPEWLENQ